MMLIIQILHNSGQLLLELLPYILIGIFLAEILKYTPWTNVIRKAIGQSPVTSVIISSVLGILSPLSTYGTIPIVINLYRGGVPLAPLLTFLSASSLMNPQLFAITWGGLGSTFAWVRFISIVLFTLILGYTVQWIDKRKDNFSEQGVNERLTDHNSKNIEKSWKDFSISKFLHSFYGNLEFIGYYVVLGVLISTSVEALVPLSTLLSYTSGFQWLNVILASLLGIPLYACGGAVIPMVSSLIENGMSSGAAIAFLIVGPGTRITPLLALGSFLTKRMLGYYVLGLMSFSIVIGIIINYIVV